MERKKRILNFRNFLKKHQGYYLIFDQDSVSKLKLEQTLYHLFKDPQNETQFPFIQYIEKNNKIARFDELQNNCSYYVKISNGSNKFFNYDHEEVKEMLRENLITILKEEEYIKSMDLTNMLALKERVSAIETLYDKETEKLNKKNQECLALMLDHRDKIDLQTKHYIDEEKKLENIETEFRLMADQYNKMRIIIEKNLFYSK